METMKTGFREEKIRIDGMTCDGCAKSIQEALLGLKGVLSAEVYQKHGEAIVRYDTGIIDLPILHRTISTVGYRVIEDSDIEKPGFLAKFRKKLREFKEDMEKNSVANANYKVVDCCHPPEEIFKRKK